MMPWFPRDYMCSTRTLSLAQRGAYTDLLFWSWDNGPLPSDHESLMRILSCTSKEFEHVWPAICDKFVEYPDGLGRLVNLRLEEERKKYSDYRRRQSEGGRKGAEKKWAKERGVVRLKGV
jgi:uncharacterized protein YdaU (DUF1376 family)